MHVGTRLKGRTEPLMTAMIVGIRDHIKPISIVVFQPTLFGIQGNYHRMTVERVDEVFEVMDDVA